jgi:hypothetical protein
MHIIFFLFHFWIKAFKMCLKNLNNSGWKPDSNSHQCSFTYDQESLTLITRKHRTLYYIVPLILCWGVLYITLHVPLILCWGVLYITLHVPLILCWGVLYITLHVPLILCWGVLYITFCDQACDKKKHWKLQKFYD